MIYEIELLEYGINLLITFVFWYINDYFLQRIQIDGVNLDKLCMMIVGVSEFLVADLSKKDVDVNRLVYLYLDSGKNRVYIIYTDLEFQSSESRLAVRLCTELQTAECIKWVFNACKINQPHISYGDIQK